jgi:hypothetical protein
MNSEAELIDEPGGILDRRPMGRPSTYSHETAETICEEMLQGKGLVEICRAADMPSRVTVYRWLESNPDFRARMQRAREGLMDFFAEQILQIAFDESGDILIEQDGDKSKAVANHAKVQRDRLKIDSLKWTAARLFPKRYGDKMELLAASEPDAAPGRLHVNWGPSVRVIVYPMLRDDGTIITNGTPEYDEAIERAANEARARGLKETSLGYDIGDRGQSKAPAQITYQPAPLPGGLSEDDWAIMGEVLRLIKQTIPTDDTSPPDAIFRILREALLLHFREVDIDASANAT